MILLDRLPADAPAQPAPAGAPARLADSGPRPPNWRHRAERLFGPDVLVGLAWVWGLLPQNVLPRDGLLAGEADAIAGACAGRRSEFVTGRWCAREAMRRLGVQPSAIPMARSGEPVWPPYMHGALTHTDGLCVAAVTVAGKHVGIDAEPLSRKVDPRAWRRICTERELSAAASGGGDADRSRLLVFCAKEAFYKAVHPCVQRYVDFLEVEVLVDAAAGRFAIRPLPSLAGELPADLGIEGRFDVWDGEFIVCGVVLSGGRACTGSI